MTTPVVALCICTFRRPEGLRHLLGHVEKLDFDGQLHICVADNDAGAEGIAVVEALADDYRWPVEAHPVTDRGISYSRNTAAAAALRHNPAFVAFLDDDEWPEPQWLQELLRVQQATAADAIGGPTLSVFPESADDEAKQNQYYGADLKLPDGSACQLEAAGNFMVRASTLEALAPHFFHPDFALSGGEDLAFFMTLRDRQARMHWASEARVHETVPDDRLSIEWLRKRVIVIANSRVHVMRMLEPGIAASLVRGIKTIGLGSVASLLTLAGLLHKGLSERARIMRWKFWGKLTAHLQMRVQRAEGR